MPTRSELCSAGCDNTLCAACVVVCTDLLHMNTSHDRMSKINITDKLSAVFLTCTMNVYNLAQVRVMADSLSVMLILDDLQDSNLVKVCVLSNTLYVVVQVGWHHANGQLGVVNAPWYMFAYQQSFVCRYTQDRLLWRDKTCPESPSSL